MSDFHLGFCLGRFSPPSRVCRLLQKREETTQKNKKQLVGFLASLATHDRPLEVNKPPITQVTEGGF